MESVVPFFSSGSVVAGSDFYDHEINMAWSSVLHLDSSILAGDSLK